MSAQKKWKLAQTLCLAVMMAGVIGLGVSVFGEAGPARAAMPQGAAFSRRSVARRDSGGTPLWGNLARVLAQRRRKGK